MTSISALPFALLAVAACAAPEAREPSAPAPLDVTVTPIASAAPTDSTPDAAASADDAAPAATDARSASMFGDPIDASVFTSGGMGLVGDDGGGGGRAVIGRLREGAVTVTGALPPEVVRRIVRQNFGRFRLCYENALRTNPTLAGTVVVRFEIDQSGAVSEQSARSSTLRELELLACVVRGFGDLSFPQPNSGTVTVTYPITFAPR